MVELVMAMDEDGLIGIDNQLPWHISEELKFFKMLTSNQVVIMGRKTYESIGKPLPNRDNLIITKTTLHEIIKKFNELANQGIIGENLKILGMKLKEEEKENTKRVTLEAIDAYIDMYNKTGKRVFVIGGKSIYKQFLPKADLLHISTIKGHYKTGTEKDVFLNIDLSNWELIKTDNYKEFIYRKYKRKP